MVNDGVSFPGFLDFLASARWPLRWVGYHAGAHHWASIWATHVCSCAQQRVRYRPDRRFTRDRQEYRRKSRDLEKLRGTSKRKYQEESRLYRPETRKEVKGLEFLLS